MPQTISGRVISRTERNPVSGVIVDIVDARGTVVGSTQTDTRGWFSYLATTDQAVYAVPRLERSDWDLQLDQREIAQTATAAVAASHANSEAAHAWHTPHTGSGFTQANHDALANSHHSNSNDHVNSEAAHAWHSTHVVAHSGLTGVGTNTHAQVDSHIADTGIHGGGSAAPTGTVAMFAGAAAPTGWLLCNGAAVSQATYAALYAIIGLTYGDPGGGNFNLPDLRGCFPLGVDAGHALASTGGAIDHAHTGSAGHDAHVVTQPGVHSAHVVTQPGAHVFTQPAAHSAHVVTQPNNHTDVVNHVHRENRQSSQSGALDGWAAGDTATATPLLTGYSTANPTTGGVAAQVHAGTAVDAHSAHAGGTVDAHSGAAVDAHSAHSGTAVDVHSAHGSTGTGNPPYIALNAIIKT